MRNPSPVAGLLLGVLLCTGVHADDRAWVAESDRHSQVLLDVLARYVPEQAAVLGVEGHDAEVFDLKPGYDTRSEAELEAAAAKLVAARASATDPRVQQDLDILIRSARDQVATSKLNRRLMLPYFDLPQQTFSSFNQLLDPSEDGKRYPAALTRLKRYTGAEKGYTPITELAKARTAERFGDASLTGPWNVEVEQNLKNTPRYLAGIRELFVASGLKGYEKDLARLEQQFADYDAWLRSELLPRARSSNLLPPEVYADNLRNYGVDADPQQLIEQALRGYQQTRDELDALARQLAQQRGWASSDYRDVLRELRKETIPNDQLLERYRARLVSIEDLVRRENLIALPERKAVIRLGTEAESAQQPAPHLVPPRMIGNTGEPAEFVLPLENPNAAPGAKMDDFNWDAITWSLTAHEARPGHELQFAKMTENGVSVARAVYAFNSANVEGWALYAEGVMKQYYPIEGQIGALQFRLMRAARAFLDPMINLGQLQPDQALSFLQQEVGLSQPMAKQEVDRYTFRGPGQATSYFYGYERLQALRARTELLLGAAFEQRSFHDFVIEQGLLPPELLEKAVIDRYVPARLAATKAAPATKAEPATKAGPTG